MATFDEAATVESSSSEPQEIVKVVEITTTKESSSVVVAFETPKEESTTTHEPSAAETADESLAMGEETRTKISSSVSVIVETLPVESTALKECSSALTVETLDKEEEATAVNDSSCAAANEAITSMEEVITVKESSIAAIDETLATSVSTCEDASNGNGGNSSSLPEGEEQEKTLECADDLMEKGSQAIKTEDYIEAVDCFSRALEIRVAHYGELAPECARAYYKYGCALLYKAQEEADPLVSVPKKEFSSEADKTVNSGDNGEASVAVVSTEAKQDCDSGHNDGELEEDAGENNQEDGNEGSEGEGEDTAEADEDDSDLDLAWKMLDVARAIVEKQLGDSMEKVDILSALGEVSSEREDIETSLSDYLKALSILERLVEPDSRRIAELNFRICLVLEVGSKTEDAVPYCQRAISACKARLQRLMDEVKSSHSAAMVVDLSSTGNLNQEEKQSDTAQPDSSTSEKEEEIETLRGLSFELEKKLEDLQHSIKNPMSLLSELKMGGTMSASSEKGASSSTGAGANSSESRVNSSQIGVMSGGFDSPTVSTAATNGSVMHLGVVGRGVKRATVNPVGGEPPAKKPSMESSEKESGISEGL